MYYWRRPTDNCNRWILCRMPRRHMRQAHWRRNHIGILVPVQPCQVSGRP